ncbi:hypothetical protein F7734_33115 [Scytonema sp. UIC 10036]|uniref:AAA-like domain-containing protein n=1 Tax=Scytonema sp. UIC 10036 TaxID=2304196 RepID=UPI0012DA998A|nr:AAA-like domain-containing protein [Scytonema sp. UIC 10036]MUG96923.1 hypothetical protein [Scytonema sp. UIC 10036]
MTNSNMSTKRKRGVVLTDAGLKKLQRAILEEERRERGGKRFTQAELGERMGVSTSTLSRLWSLSSRTDPRTLRICFSAFDLSLCEEDYTLFDSNHINCLDESWEEDADVLNRAFSKNVGDVDFLPESELIVEPQTLAVNTARSQLISRFATMGEVSSEIALMDRSPNYDNRSKLTKCLKYPSGPLPLDSKLYIPRLPLEELAYQEIIQPGCVIRIQGGREMGKTSLMLRIIDRARVLGFKTVKLNINQVDINILQKPQLFMQWLAASISRQLGTEFDAKQHWDEEIGSNLSCTLYLKEYLLANLETPLVLVLQEVQRIFEYPNLAKELLPLLRSWHEEAQQDQVWQKLRFLIVYSTESYFHFDVNQSPFNIGLPLKLSDFTYEQIIELAKRYGIDWRDKDRVQELIKLIGGHPALINLTLYYICCQQFKLENVLQTASIQKNIYLQHLQRLLHKLQQNSQLLDVFKTMIMAKHDSHIDLSTTYKLESMGLIRLQKQEWVISCELYREFFREYLML